MLKTFKFFIIVVFFSTLLNAVVIKDIKFLGVDTFTDVQLRNEISSKIGEEFMQLKANKDSERISQLYFSKNHFNVKVDNPTFEIDTDQKLILIFRIVENQPIIIDSLAFSGNKYLSSNYIKEKLVKKQYLLSELSNIIEEIGIIYNERGFLFAEISLDNIEIKANLYNAYINVSEGTNVRFRDVIIKGNKVTKASTLLKIINLRKNAILTPDLLEQIEISISNRPYIKSCNVIPINGDQLLVDIEEDRMTLLSGILGYANTSEKNNLSGFINLNLLNLFGTDRNLEFQWQNNNDRNEKIFFSYHESGFSNIPVSGDFLLGRDEQDSTSITTNFESEIYYNNQLYKLGIILGWESIYPGSRKPELVTNSSAVKAGFIWYFHNIDSQINPTKGQNLTLKLYNHWRKIENKSYRKQAVEAAWQINQILSFPLVAHGAMNIKTFENNNITEYDYFDLGGLTSIRGYLDNQFRGYRLGWINFELRYLLSRESRLFLFSDLGYVESLQQKNGNLLSFGLGLRVNTRLGLLGIDYGLAKEDNNFRSPFDGILHFGIETKL